nr:MAG TPA: hypothetical protein [Caudoviricetes sp.]
MTIRTRCYRGSCLEWKSLCTRAELIRERLRIRFRGERHQDSGL